MSGIWSRSVAVATLNLTYQPEWTHFAGAPTEEQESTFGVALGVMAQLRPGFLFGGEARYFRRYDGIGLEELAGQALFVGPTAYFQLSERSRLTATWSVQAWGRPAGSNAALDLVNFERHQAQAGIRRQFLELSRVVRLRMPSVSRSS